jgi:8-oxo-dGTP pyrophosphatase MutT (NUDIX family)
MGVLKPWREIRRKRIADCRVFDLEESVAESPVDHSEHSYYRIVCGDWVQIIPVTEAEEVVMVRQYRHGSSSFVLEVPGGIVDPGEDPATAAVRECLEETGYRVGHPRAIGALNPNPAIHVHRLHSFYATGATRVAEIQNSSTECTEVELVPIAMLADRLRAGDIDHALVAATLWRFLHDRCEPC